MSNREFCVWHDELGWVIDPAQYDAYRAAADEEAQMYAYEWHYEADMLDYMRQCESEADNELPYEQYETEIARRFARR